MCVIRPKIVAETILGKIENSHFLYMLKIGKSKKFDKKCHSIKNTFLFPNLHTRDPMIKPKNNLKNLKILVKIHFLTKLQCLIKNDKYWKKISKIEIHFNFGSL